MMLWLTTLALALDLEEARGRAIADAVAVEQAEIAVARAQGDALQAIGATLPSVTGFASVSTGAGLTSFGFERPIQNQLGVGVTGSWTVLSPSAWGAALAARQDVVAQRSLLDWARVDARRRATSAFARAVAAELTLAAWTQAADDARGTADAVEALARAELRAPAEAARARADAASAQAALARAEAEAISACAALQDVVRDDITGACSLEIGPFPEPLAGPGTHPALAAAEATLRAAERRRLASLGTGAPSLTVSGTGAQYAVTGGESGFGWNAGARLDVPLTASGSTAGVVRSASADARSAELGVVQQERDLQVALRTAEASFAAAVDTLSATTAALAASEQALELTRRRYEQGIDDLTALLDARRTRDAAAVGVAQATGALGVALAELEAARGVG